MAEYNTDAKAYRCTYADGFEEELAPLKLQRHLRQRLGHEDCGKGKMPVDL